ncbi:TonB-dependent receptor [Zhongshania marina]|uniref:TonB-dependent receptor n=1 Tax=Zhongshania marina TaxID=2304603 RepID=A0ABX9W5Q4_9GAMM|nr:TonB-dependent receptor [Zhongshania marina]
MLINKLAPSVLGCATLYFVSFPVFAQANEEPAELAKNKPRSRLIEEVMVTAQKREEAATDVPISIAAYSAEALDARGAFDTKSLPSITPAMTITEFGGFSFIFLRGVGSDAFVPSADPSITTYVDGIFVPSSQGFSTDFGGIERVEILKGPQGTLFGRNSTGGAINVVTKNPGQEFEANLQATLANYNEQRYKIYLNVPIGDSLAFSVDYLSKEYDHQYTHPDRDVLGQTNEESRIKLRWDALDNLAITLTYNYSEQESSGSSVSNNIDPSPVFSPVLGGPDDDNYVLETDFEGITVGHAEVMSAVIEWGLDPFDVKFIVADQTLYQDYTSYDFDGASAPVVSFDTYGQFTDAKSYELQFLSKPDGWLGDDFQWVLGGYYLEGEGGFEEIYLRPARSVVEYATEGLLQLPTGLLDLLSPILDPLNTAGEVNLLARGAVGTESTSVYGQTTWYMTDSVELTLGARYTDEDRFLTYADTSAFLTAPNANRGRNARPVPLVDLEALSFPLQQTTDENISVRSAISYTPTDNQRFYISYATGYKSATYNVINIYQPPSVVKPEVVKSFELGMKSQYFDDALQLNAAIFRNEITDKQVGFVSLISGGAVALLNAEQASIDGIEFDLTWVPFLESNPGFVVTANGAYLETQYDEYSEGRGFSEETGLYQSGQDFSGNRIERTPEFSGGLGLSQTLELGNDSELEIGADVYYSGQYYFTAENKDSMSQDDYMLTNARVSYLYIPWGVRITAYGNNIFDEKHYVSLFETDFGILSTRAYPARYGLTMEVKY